jgi:hypothetical protein
MALQGSTSQSFLVAPRFKESSNDESSHKDHIESWVDWKNGYKRYDRTFNELSNEFQPETDNYAEGLEMTGVWAIFVAVSASIVLIFIVILRLKCGYFGGRVKKVEYFTTFTRMLPVVIAATGFCLFLTGSIIFLVASTKINESTNKALDITSDKSDLTHETLTKLRKELVTLDMEHGEAFNVDQKWMPQLIDHAKSQTDDTDEFRDDVNLFES